MACSRFGFHCDGGRHGTLHGPPTTHLLAVHHGGGVADELLVDPQGIDAVWARAPRGRVDGVEAHILPHARVRPARRRGQVEVERVVGMVAIVAVCAAARCPDGRARQRPQLRVIRRQYLKRCTGP
jgi:hypothetical protein